MRAELTIAIAQTNPTVGDIEGNLERVRDSVVGRRRPAPTWWCSRSWCWSATRPRTWC